MNHLFNQLIFLMGFQFLLFTLLNLTLIKIMGKLLHPPNIQYQQL